MSASIFREYIGTLTHPTVSFDEVTVDPRLKEFHFVLAFASDYHPVLGHTNGKFLPHWNKDLYNASTIETFKNEHQNVKVVVSIGERGKKHPFTTSLKQLWIANAISSLTQIINEFNLDGIDVNYESINGAASDFAECVGEVIKKLKEADVISVASIAPSTGLQIQYVTLYEKYANHIDWVNYQFYDESNHIPTPKAFVELYEALAKYYSNEKLLAGFGTDSADQIILSPKVFFDAIQQLLTKKKLPGAFIWSANESKANFNFDYEALVQQLLLGDVPK